MTTEKDQKMVSAVFKDRLDAERAFDYLYRKGYVDAEINVLMSENTRSSFYGLDSEASASADDAREAAEPASLATEGLGVGGAIGTAVGATLAAVAAIGTTLAIPPLGLIVAGPVAAALAGGGAGAVTGGLIGTLVGAGMTEPNARSYAEALRTGGVVIGVVPHTADEAEEIETTFRELNGSNVCYC
jgi:hypothetical protein